MHILFLADNFPPEVNAPASRTFEHCRVWVREGHRVTVVTTAPNFPTGRIFKGYRNRIWQREEIEGIKVIRVWTFIAANQGFFPRVLDYLSFMITSTLAALFVRRVDVIVGTSPQFFTALAAWMSAAIKNRPWIFELRDLWPESIKAVEAMSDSAAIRMLERVEMFLYRRATRIVTVTYAFKETLIRRGIEARKIVVVTNGVNLERFTPQPRDQALQDQLQLNGKFVAGYIGTHGLAHALDTVLEAAALLGKDKNTRDISFLFIGDGAEKAALVEKARAMNLDNVLFVDTVPKAQVPSYWSLLDVAIIHLRKSELFGQVIPSKLFECMAMGIPVLHGVAGESAEIVTREEVGILFESQNAHDLATSLIRLRADQALRSTLRHNGPRAARRYDRAHLALEMLGLLVAMEPSRS